MNQKKQGFTLIEMSMVLVIIGLIVGGVLVGQELIKAAEIRAQISDVEKLNVSVNTFKLKYNCLPGDCKNATLFFASGAQPEQVVNGNGDKKICGEYASGVTCEGVDDYGRWYLHATTINAEWFRVFDHLAAAGLWGMAQYDETDLAGSFVPGVGFPKVKINSKGQGQQPNLDYIQGGMVVGYSTGISYVPTGHKIKFGICSYDLFWINDRVMFACGTSPVEAFALDSKIDDGKPYSGSVYVMSASSYPRYVPGGLSDNTHLCGVYAQNRYLNENEMSIYLRDCGLTINAQF